MIGGAPSDVQPTEKEESHFSSKPMAAAARPAAVQKAVSGGRFDAASIAPLEAHVIAQRTGTADYDLEANLTLLALYSLNASRRSWVHSTDILLLAVCALPETDHVAVSLALPSDAPEDIKAVQALATLLETGALAKVWSTVAAQGKWTSSHVNLSSHIRRFIVSLLESTYQSMRKAALAEALHVAVEELAKQPGAKHWNLSDSAEWVSFPVTDANQPKVRKTGDSVPFEQLSKVLTSTQ